MTESVLAPAYMEGAAVPATALPTLESVLDDRPRCPVCAIPMWLVKIEQHASRNLKLARRHFECKVCDTQTILPPLEA